MGITLHGPESLMEAVRDLLALIPESGETRVEFFEQSMEGKPAVICRLNGKIAERVTVSSCFADRKELKQAARAALVKGLRRLDPKTGIPWGILTGIRPTKIVHRLLDQGLADQDIAKVLSDKYLISAEKIALVLEVARLQRSYLLDSRSAAKLVSVYIGIPFCPSRCVYCSFPSYIGQRDKLKQYLDTLGLEIRALGNALRKRGLAVQSLYIGGGTPTVLNAEDLHSLLECCREEFVSGQTVEITVEAGRPDTIDQVKLRVMHDMGVNRLSINPQSMVAKTLQAIGRSHTPEQVRDAFKMARRMGFGNINMDIILGLPGESLWDLAYTLKEIALLEPDSLTVHALAVKRAAPLREELGRGTVLQGNQAGEMQVLAMRAAGEMKMRPYYLYRQKQILGNSENIGYAKPGKESVYNIQIMEERQSILAAGAGAASKIVNPRDWSLVNLPNPKDSGTYYMKWQETLAKKLSLLDKFLTGLA